jgi:hypothetical protein
MKLRTATSLALAGLLYTALHKLAYGLFPSLGESAGARAITALLWLAATATLVLFALAFLKVVAPRAPGIRYSLAAITVFTGAIIVADLPIVPPLPGSLSHRIVFGVARLFNAVAIAVFFSSLLKRTARASPLGPPIRASIWGSVLSAVLGAVSLAWLLRFLITGRETRPPPVLRPLATLVFSFAFVAVAWFLIRFRRIEDHREYAGR